MPTVAEELIDGFQEFADDLELIRHLCADPFATIAEAEVLAGYRARRVPNPWGRPDPGDTEPVSGL